MRPHPPIGDLYRTDREKRAFVDALFDHGAAHYDWTSQLLSWGTARWYRRFALAQAGLRSGMRVLDVAAGTGLVARAAADLTGSHRTVIALEPSAGMIREGARHAPTVYVRGVAESLPFGDATFDCLTMAYALRHVPDLAGTFGELRRVLRPGGRVLILEVSRPASRAGHALLALYVGRIVPWLTRLTTRSADAAAMMRYYWDTIHACVPPATIVEALRAAGFTEVRRHAYAGVFTEYHAVRDARQAAGAPGSPEHGHTTPCAPPPRLLASRAT